MAVNSNNTQVNYDQMPAVNDSHDDNTNVNDAPSTVITSAESEGYVFEQSSQRVGSWMHNFEHPEHPVRVC